MLPLRAFPLLQRVNLAAHRHRCATTTASAAAAATFSLWMTIMTACLTTTPCGGQPHFDCPLAIHLDPCTCTERARGLDVTCTDLSSIQLREVLDVVEMTQQTVWFLRITRADLNRFPQGLLKGLDIRNLIAVMSNVSGIEELAFASEEESRIESLDLSSNALEWVPTRALSALTSLAALSLDHNAIEVLEAYAFKTLSSLLYPSLYGNRIRSIDSRAFLGTEPSLTRLDLGSNRLGQVPRYALQRLKCLQGLGLHGNNISEVLAENLPSSLCDLDLSGNDLVKLEAEEFRTLKHISSLDLEGNKIRSIHEEAFKGIYDSLEWLKLGRNELLSVPYAALRNLSRLRQLDLRCNRISFVDSDSFGTYGRTLKFIFLQKNRIREIEAGSLDVLESAQWLYLHSNELKTLSLDTMKPIMDNLHVLDFHDNPFHCDCEVLWFRDWLLAKGQNVANLPKETRCSSPEEHSQEPIVKLTNSSFVCSDVTRKCSNGGTVLLLLFLVINVFSKRS